MMRFTAQDEQWMRRALALARRGVGKTAPNPAVGAVLVRGGKIIGEGWHRRAGGPHAEIEALQSAGLFSGAPARGDCHPRAGSQRQDMTLYVTLEPCCTHGRTPPCTEAIIAVGVKRVVAAVTDPNPRHAGRGFQLLRRAGICVDVGLLAEEARQLNRPFNKWITSRLPWVIAKAALSLDGKMATATGDSKWITSEMARREAHRLRAKVDAIMVGANTVIRDDPRLTVRHGVGGRQPWRVVVDGRGRSPLRSRVFRDEHRHRTIVLTTRQSAARWRQSLALQGVVVLVLTGQGGPMMKWRTVLRELGRLEITSVLAEGGGELLRGLFAARIVDEVVFFFAPKVIGEQQKVRQARCFRGRWRRLGRNEIVFTGWAD